MFLALMKVYGWVVLALLISVTALAQPRHVSANARPAYPEVLTSGCITRGLSCGQDFNDVLESTGCKLPGGINIDQFNVLLVKDSYLTIEMVAVFRPYVALYETVTGNLVAGAQETSQVGATLRDFKVPTTGTYGIVAGALRQNDDGFYALKVRCASSPSGTGNPCGVIVALTPGVPLAGVLATSDCRSGTAYVDNYSFNATIDVPLTITYTPSFAPYLEALPIDGLTGIWRQLETTTPITFVYWPELSGVHRLIVSSFDSEVTGAYAVKVEPAVLDACTIRRRTVRH